MTPRRFRLPMSPRSALVFLFDLAAVVAAWLAAFWLRFNLDVPAEYQALAVRSLAWSLPIYGVVFFSFGLYRGLWQFASLNDLIRITKAVATGAAGVALAAYLLRLELLVPRSVMLLSPLILVTVMGGARGAYRAWKERRDARAAGKRRKPVLIVGAARTSAGLVRDIERTGEWKIVGLLDVDQARRGLEIHGYTVLGSVDDMARVAARTRATHAILAMPEATTAERQRVATLCARAGLAALALPTVTDLVEGRVTLDQARRLDPEDLLGREPVRIDSEPVSRLVRGRTVMVTGAGGSIGSELCRQVARFEPSLLVLFEQSELALYKMQEEFAEVFPNVPIAALIGDVKDEARVRDVLEQTRPSVVFHAAAYKHVPLMEHDNAWQAILNNVFGTYVVAAAAAQHGVERFVQVSTDKAVNPTNVMGATKRLAEMVCQAVQQTAEKTALITVRFGNVLGSAGSVIPKFHEQVLKGGPVTVTHPDVTRYFMSIPEAVQLVLQAAAMGQPGEIFALDMGKPVRIAELARNIIRLAGRSEQEIEIRYTGLRPGEKLHEEVIADDEAMQPTPHPKLRVARARPVVPGWLAGLLAAMIDHVRDPESARAVLRDWVPEYRPEEGGPGATAPAMAPEGAGESIANRSTTA